MAKSGWHFFEYEMLVNAQCRTPARKNQKKFTQLITSPQNQGTKGQNQSENLLSQSRVAKV